MNNVIIFPTLRRSLEELEEESYELIEDEAYEEALGNINELFAHQYTSFDINVSKIHCLTKLGRLQEAEEFSENLLSAEDDEYYYDYLGYYIMILYEQNNFNDLMTTILEEEKKRKIPSPFNKKFKDIYRLCYQMNMMKANDLLNDLEIAMKEENHQEQLSYIHKWIQLNVDPTDVILQALEDKKVHPVVKTKLLEVLRERNIDTKIKVEKFGEQKVIQPNELIKIEQQPDYLEALNELSHIDQQNPTLYHLIEKLLYQYHYIRYPFLQNQTDIHKLVEALVYVGKKNLSLDLELKDKITEEVQLEEVQLIEICSQLYLNFIPE